MQVPEATRLCQSTALLLNTVYHKQLEQACGYLYGAGIFFKTGFLCFSFSSLDHTPTAHYLKQMSDTTILDLTSWIQAAAKLSLIISGDHMLSQEPSSLTHLLILMHWEVAFITRNRLFGINIFNTQMQFYLRELPGIGSDIFVENQ